jgi:gentisate 1,2-dioxygenase
MRYMLRTTKGHGMTQATDLRDRLSRDAKSLNLVQFWEQRADIELLQPRAKAVPYRWQWNDIEPRLRVASKTVPIEECERRALVFANPGLDGKPYITHTLFAAYSLYNPGELAPVHRHTPSASRFVLEGDGGFTTVQGEKISMARGDLILTPTGAWHDHGNDGSEPVIWVDVLNVPLVESLNATMFEFDYEETDPNSHNGALAKRPVQTVRLPAGHSQNLYAAGGLKPVFVQHARGTTEHSPMFVYKWEATREALHRLRDYDGSPYEGIILEYIDPTSGNTVMPSMSFRSQMLRKGEETKVHRRMSSTAYVCLEGSGVTQVGDVRLEWGRNDVFAVPSWAWHNHKNTGPGDAVLYSVTDEPAMRKLGLFRHEQRGPDGRSLDIAA